MAGFNRGNGGTKVSKNLHFTRRRLFGRTSWGNGGAKLTALAKSFRDGDQELLEGAVTSTVSLGPNDPSVGY